MLLKLLIGVLNLEKKEKIKFKQKFPNVKRKYTYVEEIDEIVLSEEVEDLVAKYNSERHTCLKDTLQRFLGEDYQKLYGEQQIIVDDKNVADEYEKLDKLEFYTHMNNFVCDMRKKYGLSDTLSLNDIIKYCGENADKVKKFITEKEKKTDEKIQTEPTRQ